MSDVQEAIHESCNEPTVTDLDVNPSNSDNQNKRKNSKCSDKSDGKKSNKSDKSEGKKSNKSDKSESKMSNKSDKNDKKRDECDDDKNSEKSEKGAKDDRKNEDKTSTKSNDEQQAPVKVSVIAKTDTTDEIDKNRMEINSSTPKTSKKKGFLSSLLSCGPLKGIRKKKITIDITNACEVFDARITSENGFIAGALCDLNDGENYAHMPSKFQLKLDEITALKSNTESYTFNGDKFTRIRLSDQKSIFGTCDSDETLNISIKHNTKLLLVATWKNDDHQCARIFTESYDDILKNNKVN